MKTFALVCLVSSAAVGAFAAAPGRHISGDYRLSADGRPVDVVRVPTPEPSNGCIVDELQRQPYSYASFVATGAVEVCVRSGVFDLSRTEILPKSKGVAGRLLKDGGSDALRFRMTPPMTLVLEPRGRHRALVVSANLPEANPPRKDDPKVRYFGPGFHHADQITLGDGETLYLAPGAWVEGWLYARGRNMTICGSGVLSGACYDWHQGPYFDVIGYNSNGKRCNWLTKITGENVVIRDVTLFSSRCYTLGLDQITNAVADNVKIIGARVINDDGIDVCSARNVTLRNSFVRCQDDCIAPKWCCENLVCTNLTLWTDAANVVRVGYECDSGASGRTFTNHLYKDIDILHLALNKRPPSAYWANCAIYLQAAKGQLMGNLVFDDIRFHDCGPGDIFLNVKTMPITSGYSPDVGAKNAGFIRDVVLRNIRLPDSRGGMCVNLAAHDAAHPIENVRFENVTGYGPVTKSGKVDFRCPVAAPCAASPAKSVRAAVLPAVYESDAEVIGVGTYRSFCNTNEPLLKGKPRGIVVELPGLGGGSCLGGFQDPMRAYANSWSKFPEATAAAGLVHVYMMPGPWSWMNPGAVRETDLVVDALRKKYGLAEGSPLVAAGGSMGGLGALVYAAWSRHRVTACAAACPCYDVPACYACNPSFPRTYVSAIAALEMPLKEGLERISPAHLVDRMPDIPYFIVCDMKDEIFPEKGMDAYVARLKTRCRSVEYVKLPNQRHGGFTPEARRRLHDFVCKP